MHELFVYYRVRGDAVDAALGRVSELQARLRADHPGLSARLLRRPEAAAAPQTWMEIYAIAGAGVGPELQATIETRAAALLPLLDGPRHIEVFVECAS